MKVPPSPRKPPYNLRPEVWVMDESHFERASKLVEQLTLDDYDEKS